MIYCVEDDLSIRDLMIYALTVSGFEAVGFENGDDLFLAIEEKCVPELIILDIMLPGDDGMTILKKLRNHALSAYIPVIMATAKGTEYDKVMGLDLGADDYLVKPFGMMEMISRVKAILRRTRFQEERSCLKVGEIELNMAHHTVFVQGQRIDLTLKEYEILRLFMENMGRVFTRDQLLKQIWETNYVGETRTVDVHIGTLRTKLGSCGHYIETVRGVGYRMEIKL